LLSKNVISFPFLSQNIEEPEKWHFCMADELMQHFYIPF